MRIARILPGIAVLNGHVFVCGGEVDSQILANGEIYDPHEDTWCEMASMTIPRCEFGEYLKSCSFKWRILSRTSTEQSGKNEKKNLPTGLQVHLEDMF